MEIKLKANSNFTIKDHNGTSIYKIDDIDGESCVWQSIRFEPDEEHDYGYISFNYSEADQRIHFTFGDGLVDDFLDIAPTYIRPKQDFLMDIGSPTSKIKDIYMGGDIYDANGETIEHKIDQKATKLYRHRLLIGTQKTLNIINNRATAYTTLDQIVNDYSGGTNMITGGYYWWSAGQIGGPVLFLYKKNGQNYYLVYMPENDIRNITETTVSFTSDTVTPL